MDSLDLHLQSYTKQICYQYFNVAEQDFLNKGIYVESGRVFLVKTKETNKLVNEWWSAMDTDYGLYDHSTTSVPELSSYIQSRHDQTILNFVLLKNNLLNLNNIIPERKFRNIFVPMRNRSGISRICANKQNCECNCCVNPD